MLLLVDMHQDLFCQRYGNGAPLWACPDDIPYQPLEPWFLNYASAAVTAAFDRFWTDAELRGHLVRAWAELGRALADLEAVVAFEPINEPWPGSFPPESFEPLQLSGFYSEVIAGLDRAAPGRLYVLEPAVTRQISGRTWLALPPRADLVYAPHYYHPRVESGQGYTEADRPALLEELERIRSDGQRLGLPILLGEYGGQSSCPGFADYLEQLEQELEAEGISSSLWEHARDARGFGLLDTEGQVKQEMRAFLRPYALRVPGRRVVERYAAAQGCYRAFFEGDPAVPGPLELVLPRRLAGGELILRSQSDPAAAASPRLSAERTRLVLPYPARGGIRDLEVCGLATP
ncbi:MAG: glycoside hydrolase family 5 protein [Deltaproteobacteria bacterium]|nr:glycoside hydrolase family 5 protein [Deltaproteobacteria bacterium]